MYKITAYLSAGILHSFTAPSLEAAREIATRIVQEGLWVEREDGSETHYPTWRVYKVKVERIEASPATSRS